MTNGFKFLAVLIILVPSFVSAAWWNPLSWKVFHKPDTQTQILENRVKELEKKLNETATSTATTTVKEILPTKEQIKKITAPIPQQIPPKANTKSVVSTVAKSVADTDALYADVQSKYYLLSQKVNQDYADALGGPMDSAHMIFIDGLRKTINADMGELLKALNVVPKPADLTNFYSIKYLQLSSQYYGERAEREKQVFDNANKQKEEQQALLNAKPLQREANLKAINQKILDLNRKYLDDITNSRGRGDITQSGQAIIEANITSRYNLDYQKLQLDYQQELLNY